MICLPISKRSSRFLGLGVLAVVSVNCLSGQTAAPVSSIPSVGPSWTTYNGDLSGRRFSTLDQVNRDNVKSLTLAWAFQTHSGLPIKGTPLEINGILYLTTPDHVWALDARNGQQIWVFNRPSQGNHIAQRGVAFYNDRLYFGTPDAHLICLDARNGKQIWDMEIADWKFGYYLSVAPIIVKGKVLVGTSGDQTNIPHFLEARDWQTGALVWRTDSVPKPGAPGSETWPNAQAMNHGGGAMWMSGTYDADLNLMYWGTANPHPVLDGKARPGNNLYTCSILAINPDTGVIVWYFQPSPHDTHDWDANETTVLFDGEFNGKPHKMLAQASRNGYFFVLDRQTGQDLVTSQYVPTNWALGVDAKGRPVPDPAKEPQPDGSLVRGTTAGATNWMPPSLDPETKMLYVDAQEGYSFWYLSLDENGDAVDHQGGGAVAFLTRSVLVAVDYQSGKVRWTREIGAGRGTPGVLTTAGHLLFTGDLWGNVLALDPSDGTILWHARGGGMENNGPMTYELNGRQYVVTGVDDVLYAWALPEK
jgi:alcohol dehydrogenase (cytochrome c)